MSRGKPEDFDFTTCNLKQLYKHMSKLTKGGNITQQQQLDVHNALTHLNFMDHMTPSYEKVRQDFWAAVNSSATSGKTASAQLTTHGTGGGAGAASGASAGGGASSPAAGGG